MFMRAPVIQVPGARLDHLDQTPCSKLHALRPALSATLRSPFTSLKVQDSTFHALPSTRQALSTESLPLKVLGSLSPPLLIELPLPPKRTGSQWYRPPSLGISKTCTWHWVQGSRFEPPDVRRSSSRFRALGSRNWVLRSRLTVPASAFQSWVPGPTHRSRF